MTIAKGEIDETDRCRPCSVSFIVDRQDYFFILQDYDASLSQRPSSMPLRRILPLLSCPLCVVVDRSNPHPLLRHPFTLHCGHTVCSSHLKTLDPTQRCPLPICSSTPNPNTARPNIPSTSRVVYLPAEPPPPSARRSTSTPTNQFGQRVDITISKLIEVVSRHSPPPPSNQPLSEGEDHQDQLPGQSPSRTTLPSSDEETEFAVARDLDRSVGHRRRRRRAPELTSQPTLPNHPASTLTSASSISVLSADSVEEALPPSPGHAGPSCSPSPRTAGGESSDGSDLSPEPPRKRPRRDARHFVTDQSRAIEPEAETYTAGTPNHLSAILSHPDRLETEPRRDPEGTYEDLRARIDKELLTELNCEICFTIYYQPVTTPCQHVSCLQPLGVLSFSFPFSDFFAVWRRRHLQPNVRSGFIFIGVLHSRGSSDLTILFERRSAEDVFKGLWTTGVTVLSAGWICLILYICWTPLKTRPYCR